MSLRGAAGHLCARTADPQELQGRVSDAAWLKNALTKAYLNQIEMLSLGPLPKVLLIEKNSSHKAKTG